MNNEPITTPGYDFIGDVHGSGHKLEALLEEMGYSIVTRPSFDNHFGAYAHPTRQAVFVGDLIDRGPNQLGVLNLVKAMADYGSAQVVMGNHELNALAYATPDPQIPGEFCRTHKRANQLQHAEFLNQLTSAQRRFFLEWFLRLPLWLDLGEVRVVHACWNEKSRKVAEELLGGNTLSTIPQLIRATKRPAADELYGAVEKLLKGPEMDLTELGLPEFFDKDGHARHEARIRWWIGSSTSVADLAELPSDALTAENEPYPDIPKTLTTPQSAQEFEGGTPVIYGHYWRKWVGEDMDFFNYQPIEGVDWTHNTACVDFSAVRGGPLVAYRWNKGDTRIYPDRYLAFR